MYAQTMAFLSLIVVQWANALAVNFEFRSWVFTFIKPNFTLLATIAASIGLNVLLFLTPIGEAFGITSISIRDMFVAIMAPTVITLLASDLHKLVSRSIAYTPSV
jgi:magnesium-transporting ATPase (P-type)